MLPPDVLALALALVASFAFWIFVAYGTFRAFHVGMCSVCGAVVTVWGLDLAFGFLPAWATLLLMGQSVVGGATLARDLVFRPLQERGDTRRLAALAQLAWFGLIVAGTVAAAAAWLALEGGEPLGRALLAPLPLAATMLGTFVASVLLAKASERVLGFWFCYVCAAVASIWILNLALRVFPPWVTILLVGESIAGAAMLGRDLVAARTGINRREERSRRLLKQAVFFGFILGGTLAGAGLVLAS